MGIGFQLLATLERALASPYEILQEMEAWVKAYCVDLVPSTRIGFSETTPTLFCQLHPAAEELEVSFLDLNHIVVSARTSTVGPGYHIFVCDMLRKLGKEFRLTWDAENDEEYLDEGNYFFSGNQENVFDEMTAWLRGLCQCFFNGTFEEEPGDRPVALCLPVGVTFEAEARAVTPMGSRGLEWVKEVSEDGLCGRDFFAWWSPELNAEYFLGRALTRMWTDVRWREPVNESERKCLRYVANSLETAFKLQPNLGYPRAEWAEILDILGRNDAENGFVRVHADKPPTIGYRRRNVVVTLPGYWALKVPGSFSDFEADEEGDFSAQDPPRSIWFTSYRFVEDPAKMYADARRDILDRSSSLLEERDGYIGRAEIDQRDREGDEYLVLTSSNVCRNGRSILSVTFADPEHRAWAEQVWRSLQPPSGRESLYASTTP